MDEPIDETNVPVPPGSVGVMVVDSGDFNIGISPEMPGFMLLVLPGVQAALAFPLDNAAMLLHDRICALLEHVLGEEQEETKNPEMVKRRLDN